MQDRVALYPGRIKLTPVAGQSGIYDMERADEPQTEGTPISKSTLLKDTTAAKLGLGENPTVDDALYKLGDSVDLVFRNVFVATENWSSDATYSDFPYRASVALSGVTASMTPEVIFGASDAVSGKFAPVADSYNGGVYLYASEDSEVTIPQIRVIRG